MAQLHFKNVTKTYGKGDKAVAVIHGVSMDINHGEFIVMKWFVKGLVDSEK